MALLALVVGTWPAVSPTMMLAYLHQHFGISEDRVTVRHTWSDDFIVRFTEQADLDRVLRTPSPESAPFALR